MNIALWIVQVLLAALFLFAGGQKVILSREALIQTPMGGYAKKYSANVLKLLGAVEVLGAIGLILPWLTGILPWLTPLAATGLALVMVGATYVRLTRKENQLAIGTIVFFLMSLFVAYGRFIAFYKMI